MQKVNVFEEFTTGALWGLKTVVSVLPTLIGLMVAIAVLRDSGFLTALAGWIGNAVKFLGIPAPVVPVIIIRMFSSSAALGLSLDIFKNYGADSYSGFMTGVLMSSTETIFYTMSVYFMAAKVTKTRWTLPGALVATFAGVSASVVITILSFK